MKFYYNNSFGNPDRQIYRKYFLTFVTIIDRLTHTNIVMDWLIHTTTHTNTYFLLAKFRSNVYCSSYSTKTCISI